MLKTLNMILICCPVNFSEEIIVVFQIKKSQIYTGSDKSLHNFNFSSFLRIFCQIFDRIRKFEFFKGSPRKKLVFQGSFPNSLLHLFKEIVSY